MKDVPLSFRGEQCKYGHLSQTCDVHGPRTFMEMETIVDTYRAVFSEGKQLVQVGHYVKVNTENVSISTLHLCSLVTYSPSSDSVWTTTRMSICE